MTISNAVIMAAPGEDVDLAGSWTSFWTAIKQGGGANFTSLLNVLAIFGMCLVAWAIVKWAWDRRRGGGGGFGGGGSNGVTGALLVGVVLAAPNFILPAVLSVLDLVIDAVMKIWDNNGL
jgi:hypothetical protein